VGAVQDTRWGSAGAALGPFVQRASAGFFYLAPEVRGGLKLRERLYLTLGIEVSLLIAAQRPSWSDQPFTTTAQGRPAYAFFPAAPLTGSTIALFLPTVGARYAFY
jgi:hypothetical protein